MNRKKNDADDLEYREGKTKLAPCGDETSDRNSETEERLILPSISGKLLHHGGTGMVPQLCLHHGEPGSKKGMLSLWVFSSFSPFKKDPSPWDSVTSKSPSVNHFCKQMYPEVCLICLPGGSRSS